MPSYIYRPPSIVPNLPKSSWVPTNPPPPPPEVPNVGIRLPTQEANPPLPFPGQVIFFRNPYGEPPASTLSAQYTQTLSTIANPDPPFPGHVTAIRPAMGETPPIILPTMASIAPNMTAPFAGDVLTALATPFGISALPSRPYVAEMATPPPAFQGSVITSQPRQVEARPPSVPTGIVRQSDPIEPIRQPVAWSGVPPRDASFTQHVVQALPPPPYMGDVIAFRNQYGSSPLPQPGHVPVRMRETVSEPGSVIAFGGRVEEIRLVARPSIVSQVASQETLSQPRYWVGAPPRDAAHGTITIVSQTPSQLFPGHVYAGRSAFGLEPLPSRPFVAQKVEEHSAEHGRVLFQRTIEPAPVLPPRSLVIRSDDTNNFPGHVTFRGGVADPVVRPVTYLIAGATNYPDVIQPMWGYGHRDGSGAPPTPGAGYPVTLYGTDTSVITLTSIENCDCR